MHGATPVQSTMGKNVCTLISWKVVVMWEECGVSKCWNSGTGPETLKPRIQNRLWGSLGSWAAQGDVNLVAVAFSYKRQAVFKALYQDSTLTTDAWWRALSKSLFWSTAMTAEANCSRDTIKPIVVRTVSAETFISCHCSRRSGADMTCLYSRRVHKPLSHRYHDCCWIVKEYWESLSYDEGLYILCMQQ